MKVTIEITGSDRDYMVNANTSQPLNDETRLVLNKAVSSLVGTTAEMDETTDNLVHMKEKRDSMKQRNKSARKSVDDLANAVPVWVGNAYPCGGDAYLGENDIAKAKTKAEAVKKEADSDLIPF